MSEEATYPNITSFVIRFVQEQTGASAPAYRGVIRHVQTDREIVFTCWKDAQDFIQEFVPILAQGGADKTQA